MKLNSFCTSEIYLYIFDLIFEASISTYNIVRILYISTYLFDFLLLFIIIQILLDIITKT